MWPFRNSYQQIGKMMMNTFMNCRQTSVAALLLAGMIGSSAVAAQDSLKRTDMPRPGTDLSSCQAVNWNESLLTNYPWVMDSCHEVIVVGGKEWARFEAEFEGMNSDGTFDVDFLNRRGRSQGIVSLRPGSTQTVSLDNREYAFSELRDKQKLNFYVPEGAAEFAVKPSQASIVQVVEPRTPAAEPVRLARAEPRSAPRATTLPATAGPLPLFAAGGLFAMVAGLGMTTMRRRRSVTKND